MRNADAPSSLRDPDHLLIAILALLSLVLVTGRMRSRHLQRAAAPEVQISFEARILEVQQGLSQKLGASVTQGPWRLPEAQKPWDRALQAVLQAETDRIREAKALALEGPVPEGAGESFRRCWRAAYLGEGSVPTKTEQRAVFQALREGYGAQLLEAKLAERSDDAKLRAEAPKLRSRAEAWFEGRALALVLAGLSVMTALAGGLTFGAILAFTWPRQRPEQAWPAATLPGKRLLIALLGWFLALLVSGNVAAAILRALPFLHVLALPLIYGFHATLGIGLLCWAQETSPRALWQRLFPEASWRQAAWALGFLASAGALVILAGLALSPFLRSKEPPQRELMSLVSGASPWSLVFMLLTAAVAAPLFEEVLFRGTLLPWLQARFRDRFSGGWAATLAVAGSALTFGAIHLEGMALPSLVILGTILALAFLRTRNLLTSVIVHGLWNGSMLLFYRILMG